MARLKNNIGIAVPATESHIKAGKIRCPQNEADVEKTRKCGNNNRRRTGSGLSHTHSIACKLLDSKEKKEPTEDSLINNDSPVSEEELSSLLINEIDSFLTANGGEGTKSSESSTETFDEDQNNKQRWCAGSNCSKATDPTEFCILCTGCFKNAQFFAVEH